MKEFLNWFEDNFADQDYLHSFTDEEWEELHKTHSLEEMDRIYPEGTERRSYLELPEYHLACEAVEKLQILKEKLKEDPTIGKALILQALEEII